MVVGYGVRVTVIKPRQLSPVSQEDLRRRVVAAVESGRSQAEAAELFGVGLRSVSRWVNTFRRNGNRGLTARKRGRRAGEQRALDARQQARLRRAVLGKYPDQLALPGLVWTRGQVGELVRRWFGIGLSRITIGRYLRSWGLSQRKPIRMAYERNPEKIDGWMTERYPAIVAAARRERAVVLWLDQTGLRSDASVSATWAPVGQTPVVANTGARYSINMLSAVSAQGALRFMLHDGTVNAAVFIEFCKRLLNDAPGPVFLIVDGHPAHRANAVAEFVAGTDGRLRLFFLPGYSPELNPDEWVWKNVKHDRIGKSGVTSKDDLKSTATGALRRLQKLPALVRGFFRDPNLNYITT